MEGSPRCDCSPPTAQQRTHSGDPPKPSPCELASGTRGTELIADDGSHNCNFWQGTFPEVNTSADGYLATAPVRSFLPNGYGLYEVSGDVWEWCAAGSCPSTTEFTNSNPQGPTIGRGRVMMGGSYLCHDSYCNRYRVAARNSNTSDSSSSNCGFRTAAD
ncbi:MAG: formylglycine-generating enzyme family protein [Actinomycetota bacterium]|nr:formylglycine-generating enzyme family protein [Actinomycetota bacterium]